jgi:hypothetical protein
VARIVVVTNVAMVLAVFFLLWAPFSIAVAVKRRRLRG